ncbi:MAG: hypothetical protein KKH40_07440, partial [Nanoarchaeota archaeon]|nr:hypothetical protein [Nanoarchaeota archaeon]
MMRRGWDVVPYNTWIKGMIIENINRSDKCKQSIKKYDSDPVDYKFDIDGSGRGDIVLTGHLNFKPNNKIVKSFAKIDIDLTEENYLDMVGTTCYFKAEKVIRYNK